MNYDIKLYVHGVPDGQKMWGIGNVDANYIKAFYGRQSNVPVLMFVEVRQYGSMSYCYYTYMCADKMYDYVGRPGSYFALTLRINYFYADVQNIYNLLDAGYNKFIVGNVVQVNGGSTKYLVADFNENNDKVNSIFNSLEAEIKNYLMQFSSDTDFIPLNGFKTNGQTGAAFNVYGCVIKTVTDYVKNNGSAVLSPLYPSIKEQQLINQVNEAKIQVQKEGEVAGSTINSLRSDLNKANEEIKRLNGALGKLKTEAKNTEDYQKKYELVSNELAKKNKILERIKGELSGISNMTENPNFNPISSAKEKSEIKSIINKLHPFVDIFIMVLLLLLVGLTLPNSCEDEKEQNTQQTESGTRTSSDEVVSNADDSEATKAMEANNRQPKDDVVKENETGEIKDDEILSQYLKKKFENVRIDVAEITKSNPMKFGDNSSYTLSLKNHGKEVSPKDINGRWESKDFMINENKIQPLHSGKCQISFVVGDVVLTTRDIEVK